MAVLSEAPVNQLTPTQNAILPRQVITQTITYADYTTTAVVTLGPGEPSSVPPAPPSNSQSSPGLSSSDIGIIIGSIAGAVVLGLVIWAVWIARRRMREEMYEIEQPIPEMIHPPQRVYPVFPMSIPPPAEPDYRATSPRRMYTSHGAARGTTSFVFYDSRGHGW